MRGCRWNGSRSQKFDVLAVDAFSGDAIPVHLLTREAFSLYWRHLNPDGVLAVHVSNRYLKLGPVVAHGRGGGPKTAKMVNFETDDRNASEESDSDWVLVTSRPGFFDQPELKGGAWDRSDSRSCACGRTITAICIKFFASFSSLYWPFGLHTRRDPGPANRGNIE